MHAILGLFAPSNPRWPIGCRAALSIGIPVFIGWLLGDTSAGLLATLGSFTALYASDRPYHHRAVVVALIALAFAGAVTAGVWAQHSQMLAVGLVVVMAMAACFLFECLHIGPPGAYMLILACAAGTAMPVVGRSIEHIFSLVLAGGVVSWDAHMAWALSAPRGPERAAVARAARAVATFTLAPDERPAIG